MLERFLSCFLLASKAGAGDSCPLPVVDFRHVFAVGADVLVVFDQGVLEFFAHGGRDVLEPRHSVNHRHGQVEPVDPVEYTPIGQF
ncbi:hypothetical protein CAMM_00345 [Corynebacterium ammoniagenes DSM 20306]|nr:hypothetical protein CAMM_00345 [Corynebacterium ammoniagenes DSM 20306]